MAVTENEKQIFEEDFNILDGVEDFFEEINLGSPDLEETEGDNPDENDTDNNDIDTPEEEEEESSDSDDDKKIIGEETSSEDEENTDDDKSSPLTPYAKYLKDEGILPNLKLEDFDGSVDSLKQGMYTEIQTGVQDYVNGLPDRVKHIIENYQEGVSLEKLIQLDSEKLKYDSISTEQLEDENIQKTVLRDFYTKTTRFSSERIEKEITRLSDLQELKTEANSVLSELRDIQADEDRLEKENAQEAIRAAEQGRLETLATLQSKIKETEEFIPGVKISPLIKDKLYKNVTTPVGYDQNGNAVNRLGAYRMKNPVEAELMFNYIFEMSKEFTDWSALSKSGKKTALLELEKAARDLDNKSTATKPNQRKTPGAKDLLGAIDQIQW